MSARRDIGSVLELRYWPTSVVPANEPVESMLIRAYRVPRDQAPELVRTVTNLATCARW